MRKIFDRKIILENGMEFLGYGFGCKNNKVTELVFNTSMVGYQEIISDPSYTYQSVIMTYPLIGNYGINDDDFETIIPSIDGLIVKEYNDYPSNFRSTQTLDEVMKKYGIVGVSGIDSRKLVRVIRDYGSQRALITSIDVSIEEGLKIIKSTPILKDAIKKVSCKEKTEYKANDEKFKIVAIDCGIKRNIIRSFNKRKVSVITLPYNTKIEDRTATTTIQIINLSSHRLYKSVTTPVIEKNGQIHYSIAYKNNTDESIPDFQLLDILPYNGDSRGTDYSGTYKLAKLVVTQKDGNGSVISNGNLDIRYTEDEGARTTVTSKDSNLANDWTQVTSENIQKAATAYAIKGQIGGQGSLVVDIYLDTLDNTGLDKYVNNASAQIYSSTEELVTGSVTAQVVKRTIEGIAWDDANANGIKDASEQVFKNVEMTLVDNMGRQVRDVDGNTLGSVKTNDSGYYKFTNLPRGNYYVRVVEPNSKYTLTEKEVGNNSAVNSKFKVDEKETDIIT